MPYTVVRSFTKAEDQNWYGIYYNVEKSLNPTSDPRDAQFHNLSDIKSMSRQVTQTAKSNSEYIGSERVYENDNLLLIKYYFDTLEKAVEFKEYFSTQNTAGRLLSETAKEKQQQNILPSYTVNSYILDPDGNPVTSN